MNPDLPRAVNWRNGELHLLDQRKLPHVEAYVHCQTIEDVYEGIRTLTVRGAPAIGIAAAYGMLLDFDFAGADVARGFRERGSYLISARPTAVNLAWAVERMLDRFHRLDVSEGQSKDKGKAKNIYQALIEEATAIYDEDACACRAIGEVGLPIVSQHQNVLTHCNAGSLAVSELGTALAPIYKAHEAGVDVHVYVDETRPLLQGARLTSFELDRAGVDCTLITDNMAAHIMSEGKIDMVLVGADRIAANGDTANKIGTLNLAILCQYFDIPFYVAVPVSTIDAATDSGKGIVIEERDPLEVKQLAGENIAPVGVNARSPAFDVTPNELIAGILTEKGLLSAPFDESIAALFRS